MSKNNNITSIYHIDITTTGVKVEQPNRSKLDTLSSKVRSRRVLPKACIRRLTGVHRFQRKRNLYHSLIINY